MWYFFCIHVTIGYIRPNAIHQPWQTLPDQFISRCNPLSEPCDKIRLVIFRETNYTSSLTQSDMCMQRMRCKLLHRDSKVWIPETLSGPLRLLLHHTPWLSAPVPHYLLFLVCVLMCLLLCFQSMSPLTPVIVTVVTMVPVSPHPHSPIQLLSALSLCIPHSLALSLLSLVFNLLRFRPAASV